MSTTTLLFGLLSIPLAFLRHLCSLAVVLAGLAMIFALAGWFYTGRTSRGITTGSMRNMRVGGIAALVGMTAAVVMWILWSGNVLLN